MENIHISLHVNDLSANLEFMHAPSFVLLLVIHPIVLNVSFNKQVYISLYPHRSISAWPLSIDYQGPLSWCQLSGVRSFSWWTVTVYYASLCMCVFVYACVCVVHVIKFNLDGQENIIRIVISLLVIKV